MEAVFSHDGSSFLASATPAAGKTTFGLRVAHRMLEEGRVGRAEGQDGSARERAERGAVSGWYVIGPGEARRRCRRNRLANVG